MNNFLQFSFFKYFSFLALMCLLGIKSIVLQGPKDQLKEVGNKKVLESSKDIEHAFCLLEIANKEFDSSNWKAAKFAFFKALLLLDMNGKEDRHSIYMYGQSCLNSGDYLAAIEMYSKYLRVSDRLAFAEEAEWGRALAAIQIDREVASMYLNRIARNPKARWHQEANEMLSLIG